MNYGKYRQVDDCELAYQLGITSCQASQISSLLNEFGKTLPDEKRKELDEIEKKLDIMVRTLYWESFSDVIYKEENGK